MYSQEIADAVCTRLAGGQSLRKAAKAEGIGIQTVLDWVDANPEFSGQYARARLVGYQALAEEILDISDDGTNDSYTDDDGNERTNQDVIARSRLRVDSRKWMLSKMLPKVYGDRLDLNHSGRIATSREMSEEELAAIASQK